ncbi:MAG TPA: DMT family transporter [Saprospiraceae bacterium]|nr:DMT family transporter [Saprospiraceae bacterium]
MDIRTKGIIATVFAAVFFSTAGLVIKILPQSAFSILFFRSLFCFLLFLMIFRKKALKVNKLSLIGAGLFYVPLVICFVLATKLTTAANAIFLQYAAPAFVLLLEPKLLKIKLKGINIFTVVVCLSGMTLFFIDQLEKPDNWWGIILAVASAFALAGLIIVQKMNHSDYLIPTITYGNLFVVLIMFPIVVQETPPNYLQLSYMAFLGFVQLGVGYLFFTYGQKHISAIESALIAMLEPILNPMWVMIGYGEKPGGWAILGGLIIILALVFRMVFISVTNKKVTKIAPSKDELLI